MKRLALLGMFLVVSSTMVFAEEEQCETGSDQQASASSEKSSQSSDADAKILIKDKE